MCAATDERSFAPAVIPEDTWFHDNRRNYITNSRRLGIEERTIMKQRRRSDQSGRRRQLRR
jgi:hypothetical protein